MSSVELPVGTVTFLFTDIEGSTQLLKRLGGDTYGEALADHQRILRELFAEGGKVSDSRNEAQVGYGGWVADYPPATAFLPPILSCAAFVPESPENANLAQFCDPAIDAKMERASSLQTQDPPAATLLWQEVERDLLAHAPVVPTTNRRNADFVSARVGNYQYNPQWGALLSQLWVK